MMPPFSGKIRRFFNACAFPPGIWVVWIACILLLVTPGAAYGQVPQPQYGQAGLDQVLPGSYAGKTEGDPLKARSDLELLSDALCSNCGGVHHAAPVLIGRNRHWLVRYNPVSLTLSGLVFVYQRFISPQISSQCLYEHTCSGFSIELIETYGLARGVVFTADRLSRCNRVAAIDIHPLRIGEKSLRVIETVEIYQKGPQ